MNVNKINVFTETLLSTLEATCMAIPYRNADFEKVDGDLINENELMCVIQVTGTLSGSVVLTLSDSAAKGVFGAMMMEEVEKLDDEVAEGFSEIINMVIGNVKAALIDEKVEFSNPEIKINKGKVYKNKVDTPWLKIPMLFEKWGVLNFYFGLIEE